MIINFIMMSSDIKKRLENQQYRIIGNHSAVKICHWAKKSLIDEGFCYKQKFYGIPSHRCCQMTPSLFCNNKCVFCWRDIEIFNNIKITGGIDDPKEIIDACIEQQRVLINGFPGNPKTNMNKYKEAQNPAIFAISLSGEPTIYSRLSELIAELHKRKIKTFLVTNGQFPEKLEKLETLPTQLYVSLDAPTKEIYKRVDKPMLKDFWERLNKTLEFMSNLNTRTVLRITAINNLNMRKPEEYAKLIAKAEPMFTEVKGYMWVGGSRKRLKEENMPSHSDVKNFAKKIADKANLKLIDDKKESAAILLASEDYKDRKLKFV